MSNIGNYRAKWHDYTAKSLYHITLLKSPNIPYFGSLAGDYNKPVGTIGSSYILASPLGKIVKESLREISTIHPALKLFQYALMPDHLHLLIRVETQLDDILGRKIAIFKNLVNKKANITGVFDKGFNDQIITASRNLNIVYRYLKENPYRLAVRRANPDFFKRRNDIMIGGVACQAYGNIHLLDNPFKDQVIVHRADNDEAYSANRERWLYTAGNGGVLVSPFISKREKEIRKEAELLGSRFILITNRPLGEREKPSAHDFDLCSQGRLLIVATQDSIDFSRVSCMRMNALAATITDEIKCPLDQRSGKPTEVANTTSR